jgi:hypothetical protein
MRTKRGKKMSDRKLAAFNAEKTIIHPHVFAVMVFVIFSGVVVN